MTAITVDATSLLSASFASLQSVEYSKLFEIAKRVKDNNEVAKFAADPLGYSRSANGFAPPAGFHMHIVDSKNVYHPAEDDALSQLASGSKSNWTRVEVRAGYADIACIICLWCGKE